MEKYIQSLAEINIDKLIPKYVNCHYDCYVREFITLNRDGGRRIFAGSGFGALGGLDFLETFFTSSEFQTHYRLQDKIKDLEVVLADEKFQPQAVWKNGDDFRILVSDEERKAQIEDEIGKLDKIDDENEDLDYKIRGEKARKRRAERATEHYEWREFKNGKLGAKVDEPVEIPFLRDKLTFPAVQNLSSNDSVWQSRSGNYEIRAGEYNEGGLWKINRSEQVEFKKGVYANPIVSGNWAVAAKADQDWSAPNYVVRVNLQTGKEYKINLPPADEFNPVAFVAAHNKILLRRAGDENKNDRDNPSPKTPEYYLLDANTGKTELVKGEFRPLTAQTFRPLQPTGKPNEFWAAISDREKNETEIGIYDAKKFSFQSILKLPEITLDSMEIWVVEEKSKVYFVYSGDYGRESHLLCVPLTAK